MAHVSVLFNEPKLLKLRRLCLSMPLPSSFSALQRAEIAEFPGLDPRTSRIFRFSALQRAEIAEIAP